MITKSNHTTVQLCKDKIDTSDTWNMSVPGNESELEDVGVSLCVSCALSEDT